ncbi:MAG TPA: peptidylprolyl isomerase [Anaerolineae bacterium]|nr:peptidylprolyl isomerase [Anaerolineae bacterium]
MRLVMQQLSFEKGLRWLMAVVVTMLVATACSSNSTKKPNVPTATAGAGQPQAAPATAAPQGPAAIVNGQEISMADYTREVEKRRAGLVQRGVNLNTPEGQAQLEQEKQMVLDNMIDDLLVIQDAAKQGITVSDAELDTELQKGISGAGGQAKFEEQLKREGQTLEEARQTLRTQLVYLKMRDRVVGGLQTAEQVHARQILVDSAATAQALLAQIQAGADFAQIAQQSSKDTLTRANGGDMGWFARGVLPAKEVEDAAFALQPTEISNVVQSAFGYHIVQVLERDPARKLEGEQFVTVQQQAMENWLNGLRAQAKVQRLAGQ